MVPKPTMPACEACGAESEWRSGSKDEPVVVSGPRRTRFLCGRHRYKWFRFIDNLEGLMKKLYSASYQFNHSRWQEIFDQFKAEANKGGG